MSNNTYENNIQNAVILNGIDYYITWFCKKYFTVSKFNCFYMSKFTLYFLTAIDKGNDIFSNNENAIHIAVTNSHIKDKLLLFSVMLVVCIRKWWYYPT